MHILYVPNTPGVTGRVSSPYCHHCPLWYERSIRTKSSLMFPDFLENPWLRDFPGGPVVDSSLPMQGAQVPSLVELDPACCN